MNNSLFTDIQKESFFKKGFVVLKEKELCDFIKFDFDLPNRQERLRDNFKDDLSDEANERLSMVAAHLRASYIDALFPDNKFIKYGVWEGVDYDTTVWHNDFFEGMNVFFLLYFDTQYEESGGAIYFRYPGGEESFYPERGDCVLLNQSLDFYHRADKSTIERRIASFDFFVDDLD